MKVGQNANFVGFFFHFVFMKFSKELDNSFTERQNLLTNQMQKLDEAIERANLVRKFNEKNASNFFLFFCLQPLEFSDRLFKNSSTTEILMFKKQLENKLNTLHQLIPDANGSMSFELDFVSNFQVKKNCFSSS